MVLLQILVFAIFVLSNAYQGVITSSLIDGLEPSKMKSLEEVLDSDYKLVTGTYIHNLMVENSKYQKAFNDGRVKIVSANLSPFDYENDTYAIFSSCSSLKYGFEIGEIKNFYMIDQILFSQFQQLPVVWNSKFLRRWQLLMDWSFQAGLPQAWETFERKVKFLREEEKKSKVLKLIDLSVVFYTLIVGAFLGGFVLLTEIFWHECVQPFIKRIKTKKNDDLSLKEIQSRKFNFLRPKLKVRRVQVQPVDETIM